MARPVLHVLRLELPVVPMLRLEEALLRRSTRNFLLLTRGQPGAAIVLGISGKPRALCDVDRAAKDGVPMVKRFSGGGTVVVDDACALHSWIVAAAAAPCAPFPREIMDFTGGIYGRALATAEVLRENDYVLGERKFGGNAQSITKDRWLHHTSFLFELRPRNMAYLTLPEKRPDYRGDRDHLDFLTGLGAAGWTVPDFEAATLDAAAAHFEVVDGAAAAREAARAAGGVEALLSGTRTAPIDADRNVLRDAAADDRAVEQVCAALGAPR